MLNPVMGIVALPQILYQEDVEFENYICELTVLELSSAICIAILNVFNKSIFHHL